MEIRYLANCSILFTELPLLARPAAARAAGFNAVEFWWPFDVAVPADVEVDRFVSAVREAGVHLVGLNFFAGDMPGGDRGVLSWPARSAEFVDNLAVAVGIGEQLGTRALNALYGNRVEGATAEQQDELAVQNLTIAAETARRIGAVVLLEPVSGAPRYPLRTATDVVTVLDRVQRASAADNLRLLADLYHLTVNGDDLGTVISRYADRIGHVQIADAPGRHEPGSGGIALDKHLAELHSGGYRGWVGLEYHPSTTTEQSLTWLPRPQRGGAGSNPEEP